MKLKKSTAFLTITGMVLSLFTGIGSVSKSIEAGSEFSLPKVTGLYISEYFDKDEGKVKTVKDDSGNEYPVNWDGEQIRYMDQDNPEYLTKGIKEGWGMGFDNNDEKWFDYIADGKVTHVNPSDLVITHIDGTACDDIKVIEDEEDPRIAIFKAASLEKVKITYKGAELNNSLIGVFALRTGLYSSKDISLQAQINGDINVVKGKSKEIYFHMTDDWEEARFNFDVDNAVSIRYWDDENGKDEEITGEGIKEFADITPISTEDANHLIYKVTLHGSSKVNNGYNIRFHFKKYDINEPDNSWDEDRDYYINVVEADTLYAADQYDLNVRGGRYIYPENVFMGKDMYYMAGSTNNSVYILLKYIDENGNVSIVKDISKLTFFRSEYDEQNERDNFTKIEDGVLKVEKAYADSDIIKITYLGKAIDFGNEYVITYDGAMPGQSSEHRNITVSFTPARFNEVGTYISESVNDNSYANEVKTDGTKDIDIYAASVDVTDQVFWNTVKSVERNGISLIDENGNDISAKVKTDSNVKITEEKGRKIIYGEKITIPKGTLGTSAKMRLNYTIRGTGGDGNDYESHINTSVYIFYSEPVVEPVLNVPTPTPVPTAAPVTTQSNTPAVNSTEDTSLTKGMKSVTAGITYKVISVGKTNAVTLVKGKKNAKSVKVPDTVKINGTVFAVTQISAGAFKGNNNLTKAVIGKNVTTIGAKAFYGCKKLKSVEIKGKVLKKAGSKAFTGIAKKATAKVPKSKKASYKTVLKKGGFKGKVK